METDCVTVTSFVLEQKKKYPGASGELTILLNALLTAIKACAAAVRKAGIAKLWVDKELIETHPRQTDPVRLDMVSLEHRTRPAMIRRNWTCLPMNFSSICSNHRTRSMLWLRKRMKISSKWKLLNRYDCAANALLDLFSTWIFPGQICHLFRSVGRLVKYWLLSHVSPSKSKKQTALDRSLARIELVQSLAFGRNPRMWKNLSMLFCKVARIYVARAMLSMVQLVCLFSRLKKAWMASLSIR